MKGRRRLKLFVGTEIPIAAMVGFAVLPWFWMMLSSIRPERELTSQPIILWPQTLTLAHHIDLLGRTSFGQSLVDSFIVAVGAVALGLSVAVPAAYAFSRFRFRFRDYLRTQFLVINMFPVVMLILPLFVLMRQYGLLDTYFALIIGHGTFTLPFGIWLLTSYFEGIPQELDEAAMIDGCTRLQAFYKVVLPVAAPGVASAIVLAVIVAWGQFAVPYILLKRNSDLPIAVGILSLQTQQQYVQSSLGLLAAATLLAMAPVTALFLVMQRFVVQGLVRGAIKG